MGKCRLGRVRKYSHRKYHPSHSPQEQEISTVPPCGVPYAYQFSLRNVPSAILHQPSINNFSHVCKILSGDNVLQNNWNQIKHSELFLMLCTFTSNTTAPEKTVIVNIDFTWRVIASNINVNESMADIPEELTPLESFLHLLDFVDRSTVCPGICDARLRALAISGGRNGLFTDQRGNTKARLLNDSIKPVNCSGLWHSNIICEHCKLYKKFLLTMLSNQKSRSPSDKTSASSHCKWGYLSEKEEEERIKNCTKQRKISSKKIHMLEERFKKVSTRKYCKIGFN